VTKEGTYSAEYEHLEKIINRVISEKPKDAYGLVEVLSRLVREQPDAATTTTTAEDLEAATEYVKKIRVLDKVPGDENGPKALESAVPDFCEDADSLQWAGVGFGELESYKIKCALRNLTAAQSEAGGGFTRIRFWGKILGTDADYYVAEATGGEPGAVDEENPDDEPAGAGVNKFTYFVANDLALQQWSKLPAIKAKEIVASRRIKKLMSGKTSSKVVTHPPFPGAEEVLLRAQIARISADVTLMFRDRMKRDPEEGVFPENTAEPADNEEFAMPAVSVLMTPQGWQHSEPHILQNGRTTHREAPEPNEDEPEHADNKLRKRMLAAQKSDPLRDPIRNVDGDGLDWVYKQFGDTSLYKTTVPAGAPPGTVVQPRSNAVTCMRSLTWPGAVTVVQSSNMVQLYVGYGLPAAEPDFFPSMLPDVRDEPEELVEQPEPQGSLEEAAPPADE